MKKIKKTLKRYDTFMTGFIVAMGLSFGFFMWQDHRAEAMVKALRSPKAIYAMPVSEKVIINK